MPHVKAIAPSLLIRKNSREQKGQPYYDMSIFQDGNGQRCPKELPGPLWPKPGGDVLTSCLCMRPFKRFPSSLPFHRQLGSIDGHQSGGDQL